MDYEEQSMTSPSWSELVRVKVAAQPDGLWNLVFDYVSGPRLLRIKVVDQDDKKNNVPVKWKPTTDDVCGANGLLKPAKSDKTTFLVSTAPFGALVGKIGGSTADLPDASSGSAGPWTGRKVFAVGNYTVVGLSKDDCGPLFLTINDSPDGFCDNSKDLWVLIEEAPL